MSALKEISNGPIRVCMGNACIIKGVLAINGAGAPTVKTTGALTYGIDGILFNKNALAAQSIAVTHGADGLPVGGSNLPAYVQPASTTAYYLLSLNAAGGVSVAQGAYNGQIAKYPDNQRTFNGQGNVPQEPANTVSFGLIKVVTNGATTFTPGTTALDNAGITVTYFDLEYVPTNPQP